jgi:CRISPR-associated protein, Cse2 family
MTQATAQRPPQLRRLSPWGDFVQRQVNEWQKAYIRRETNALAILAKLRRGVGKEISEVPDLWQYTLSGLPDEPVVGDGPTRAERAVYTAMTLFAVHQQSRRVEMHTPGPSLGAALGRLRHRAASEVAIRRRFEALGTAEAFSEVVRHARGLITQLRAANIPLDYGAFTDDLIWLQSPGTASRVRLRWGRDFYRTGTNDTETADGGDNDQEEAS